MGISSGVSSGISVGISVATIHTIFTLLQDFTANMYIRQRWNDQRLANSNFSGGVLLTNKIPHTWIPDTFIKNDKISKKSEVTTLNTFLRVDENGDVLYSLRVTSTISCPMQLKRYPFDEQNCTVLFESCKYRSIHYSHNIQLPQYTTPTKHYSHNALLPQCIACHYSNDVNIVPSSKLQSIPISSLS